MSKNSITIKNSVFVNRPPEKVWDYTQDYNKRTQWDKSILEASVVEENPRVVRLRSKGNTTMSFIYKLDERPFKTSLAAKQIDSAWMSSGGGAWTYEPKESGTLWTQTNTIVFKEGWLLRLLRPLFKWMFTRQTAQAMLKAKQIVEAG